MELERFSNYMKPLKNIFSSMGRSGAQNKGLLFVHSALEQMVGFLDKRKTWTRQRASYKSIVLSRMAKIKYL